jgi:isopentenyl phosphate kinase
MAPLPEITLVKLGGSLITDKARAETPRSEVIARLAVEIADAARRRPAGLIVAHGSGSFGHAAAEQSGLRSGRPPAAARLAGISHTQDRAAALHRLVIEALLAAGAAPFSLAPSSLLVTDRGTPAPFSLAPLTAALDHGFLPVLYGDVVADRAWGASILSTERLFEVLALSLGGEGRRVRHALWLGETDGLYDIDGQTVPRVEAADAAAVARARQAIGAPSGVDVTGGMGLRLATALSMTELGVRSLLANGLTPGVVGRALGLDPGEPVPGTEVL